MSAELGTILLLGAGGQVGRELQRALTGRARVTALDIPQIDFSSPASIRDAVRSERPDIIINAAAYTAVDAAEKDHDAAFAVNAAAPAILAEEANAIGALLVHYSTDYVFDGSKMAAYLEEDRPNPRSVYGQSKLEGEQGAAQSTKHLTFRTSWVVSRHGKNFVKTMLRLARERESLTVVADQLGAPTSAALIADVSVAVLEQMVRGSGAENRWGLYHLVAGGETSWHGLAQHAIAGAVARGMVLKAGPKSVLPIAAAQYPSPVERPANSRLDTRKIRAAFGVNLPLWTEGVDAIVRDLAREGEV
jgi:dTDP-4-dehydrorhamnose reductase